MTYKWNFSFHTGFNSCGMVRVRFFTLLTCTVTYGSLVPLLSLAINPCAQMTKKMHNQLRVRITSFAQRLFQRICVGVCVCKHFIFCF